MPVSRTTKRQSIIALFIVVLSLSAVATTSARPFPEIIPLPNGFNPEGIASGNGTTFYVGSIMLGDIYRGDLRTGGGEILVDAPDGRAAIGLKYDPRSGLLFVAGGPAGLAYVYDAETGETVAVIPLEDKFSFINDVVITKDAVYFTNSKQPNLYRIALEKNGQLPDGVVAEVIPLGGDYRFNPDPQAFNANGIAATPNGKTLIIVNSWEGALYKVDPETGESARIDLGPDTVANGDGILLQGKTLYVVQNRTNRIAVVELSPDLSAGTIVDTITSSAFDVPTTIARFGSDIYAVNARFGTPPTPSTEYDVVGVPRK